MNIYRKQIGVLVLATILAIASFWIPLPPNLQMTESALLPTETTRSVPPKSLSSSREPAISNRLSVMVLNSQPMVPQTVAPLDRTAMWSGYERSLEEKPEISLLHKPLEAAYWGH